MIEGDEGVGEATLTEDGWPVEHRLVQRTPIERMLRDHLWEEIHAVDARLMALTNELTALSTRRAQLADIAAVAGIPEPGT